jgi:Zn-dependent protease
MSLTRSIPLGRILGIPLGLDYSWFLVFALVTWSLGSSYFPEQYPGWSAGLYWTIGLATSLLFFLSVILHELGHSVIALRNGIPVRSITLFIFGGSHNRARAWLARSRISHCRCGTDRKFRAGGLFGALGWLGATRTVRSAASYLAYINGSLRYSISFLAFRSTADACSAPLSGNHA